jgi:hypothetical protein
MAESDRPDGIHGTYRRKQEQTHQAGAVRVRRRQTWWLWSVPPLVGFFSWTALSAQSDGTEAWDGGAPYYTVSFALAFLLGLVVPTRWALASLPGVLLGVGQLAALLVTSEENTFLVLGLVVFAVLCVLFGMVSFIGAALRRRFWSQVFRTGVTKRDDQRD